MIDRILSILNNAEVCRVIRDLGIVELTLRGEWHKRRCLKAVATEGAFSFDYAVTGENDVVLMLRLRTMEELDALIVRLFTDQTNVKRFVTMMVIRTAKEEAALLV